MADKNQSFWTSAPGLLTGFASVITAITGLYLAAKEMPAQPKAIQSHASSTQHGDAESSMLISPKDLFVLRAVINDPDGFTHVRKDKNVSSDSIARIQQSEKFSTYVQEGSWWQVKTHDGKVGYMHASRIKLVANN